MGAVKFAATATRTSAAQTPEHISPLAIKTRSHRFMKSLAIQNMNSKS
jgi:hypothetical protein